MSHQYVDAYSIRVVWNCAFCEAENQEDAINTIFCTEEDALFATKCKSCNTFTYVTVSDL